VSAVIERSGPEGRILAAVEAYERGEFGAAGHREALGSLEQAYAWADSLTAHLPAG
jgi:hypothetical protein